MDNAKVGKLIRGLRNEKGMTQRQLADAMHLSDRTISKWERGAGCPDVSLLSVLSDILGVNIEKILDGELNTNTKDGGNMKRIRFYQCADCGNVLFSTSAADISCCGRRLAPLEIQKDDGAHAVKAEAVDNECYITIDHEMTKEHYITFAAVAGYDRVMLIKLYPEQNAELRFPEMRGTLYVCCNRHGLTERKL